jgi:sulfofructose kinase
MALLQHLPALPARVLNCSGAGDCLVAGCLFGLAQGRAPLSALACGVAASRSAVESQHNVPPSLSAHLVEGGAAEVLQRASSAVMRL